MLSIWVWPANTNLLLRMCVTVTEELSISHIIILLVEWSSFAWMQLAQIPSKYLHILRLGTQYFYKYVWHTYDKKPKFLALLRKASRPKIFFFIIFGLFSIWNNSSTIPARKCPGPALKSKFYLFSKSNDSIKCNFLSQIFLIFLEKNKEKWFPLSFPLPVVPISWYIQIT